MKKVAFFLVIMMDMLTTKTFATSVTLQKMSISIDSMGVDSVKLSDFIGKYTFENLPIDYVEVTLKETGKLHLVAGDRVGDIPPLQDKPNVFETPEVILTFIRNEKNRVFKVKVDIGDITFEGMRDLK